MICQGYDSGGEIDIEDWRFPLQHTEDDSDADMGMPMQSPSIRLTTQFFPVEVTFSLWIP